jgi:hypothetical protein
MEEWYSYINVRYLDASVTSVYVSGSDVYACGQEGNSTPNYDAGQWKNGAVTNLSTGAYIAWASSIFVSGTDVYTT